MASDRVKSLLNLLEIDPEDPFTKYALALEYLKEDKNLAMEFFSKLLDQHPEYLPTYYQAAHVAIELEQYEVAREIFEKGISLAKDEPKTQAELKNAFQNFLIEYDLD